MDNEQKKETILSIVFNVQAQLRDGCERKAVAEALAGVMKDGFAEKVQAAARRAIGRTETRLTAENLQSWAAAMEIARLGTDSATVEAGLKEFAFAPKSLVRQVFEMRLTPARLASVSGDDLELMGTLFKQGSPLSGIVSGIVELLPLALADETPPAAEVKKLQSKLRL